MVQETHSKSGGEARLSPQLAALIERIRAGSHRGERFEITITERELEEAAAWYLEREPNVPFHNPWVSIGPDGVEAGGEALLGTLRLPLTGRLDIIVQDGLPRVSAQQLEVGETPLPDFIRFQIEDELNRQLSMREKELPVVLEGIELEEGRLTAHGRIR